jgi:TaqI-like C-terminal specificity domain
MIIHDHTRKAKSFSEVSEFSEITKQYPKTASYMQRNKQRLEDREHEKFRGGDWYRFGRSQNIGIQGRVKLCVPRLVDRLYFTYDLTGNHFLDNVDVCGITLKQQHTEQDFSYLLGLLNSRLLRYFFPFVSVPFRGGWLSANRQFLSLLPIRLINFSDPADKARHDKMVTLVEQMLDLHKRLRVAKTPDDKMRFQRQIDATDKQIDQLVYELYGLTEEEIRIVEG